MKKNTVKLTALLLLLFPSIVFADEAVIASSQSQETSIKEETTLPSEETLPEATESTQTSDSLITTETSDTQVQKAIKMDESKETDDIIKKDVENKYVTIVKSDEKIWQEIEKEASGTTESLINQTFSVKEIATTKDDNIYFLLYSKENKAIGYVAKDTVKEADGAQGIYHSFGKYITLKTPKDNVFWNFDWQVRFPAGKIQNNTYFAKAYYQHANGQKYYSFFDENNKWQGYIASTNTEIAPGKQGLPISMNQYVSVINKYYKVWQNFNWKQLNHSSNMINKTYQVKAKYQHMNGSIYYSLFDWQGNWEGYINADATKKESGAQGPWIKEDKYITVSRKNYNVWQNFNWIKKQSSDNLYNKTYQVKAKYEHMNGETYYSLYDNNNAWQGYINKVGTTSSGAQGSFISDNRYVTITKKNYNTWQSFNWQKKGSSNSNYQKTLRIKGHYNHFNGSQYYSLENSKGQWQGYLNSNAATISEGAQGIYISDGRTLKVVSGNYDIWQNFNWEKRASSRDYLNQTFVMRGRYQHFNGSTYYSMYDTSGNWKGYLNANATALPVTSRVIDSVPYVSQYTPVFAPWGCAGASMTMVLRSKGVSVNLKYAMDNMPMYPQYPGGQIGKNVYTGEGFKRVIQPDELTKYMRDWYSKVYNISGASSQVITNHILDGNPVLYYGYSSYQKDSARNHVKVILGYKNNRFLIYDPLYFSQTAGPGSGGKHPKYDRGAMHWLPVSEFNKEYNGSAIVTK